tara:strand:- start:116 stop:403 length:288 start_codon:yes stop_codon:yes gene_type:complete
MINPDKHIFVCTNKRDSRLEKKSCGDAGLDIRNHLIRKLSNLDHDLNFRINKSGCLGRCMKGPVVVAYPDGDWYTNVKYEDLSMIIQRSILSDIK